MQTEVGGFIEAVPEFNTIEFEGHLNSCVAFCNEESKLKGLPVNDTATGLWNSALLRLRTSVRFPNGLLRDDGVFLDRLQGKVVVIIGDKDLLATL